MHQEPLAGFPEDSGGLRKADDGLLALPSPVGCFLAPGLHQLRNLLHCGLPDQRLQQLLQHQQRLRVTLRDRVADDQFYQLLVQYLLHQPRHQPQSEGLYRLLPRG